MREKDEVFGPLSAMWQLFKVWVGIGLFLVLLSTCSGTGLPASRNPLLQGMMALGGL